MIVTISLPILIMNVAIFPLYYYCLVAAILSAPIEVPNIEEWVEKILSSSSMLEITWRHISGISRWRYKSHGKSS